MFIMYICIYSAAFGSSTMSSTLVFEDSYLVVHVRVKSVCALACWPLAIAIKLIRTGCRTAPVRAAPVVLSALLVAWV